MDKSEFLSLIDKASTLLYQNYEEDGLKTYIEIVKLIQQADNNGLSVYLTEDTVYHIKESSTAYYNTDILGLADEIVMIGATLNG
jgi:hypothetical protein